MENIIFTIIVLLIAIRLITFIASQKELQRKRELKVVTVGIAAMILFSNPLIWILIWTGLVIYLLVKKVI